MITTEKARGRSKKIPKLRLNRALVFDTETTGLVKTTKMHDNQLPEIIEFYGAVIDMDDGTILDECDLLIKPARDIPEFITKINGITNEMVAKSLPFRKVASQIHELIREAPLVIAHNLSFDREMVNIEMKRCGIAIEWPRCLCTVEQSLAMRGYRLTLSRLHESLFRTKFDGAHRAKIDVAALIRCVVEMRKREMI